MSEAERPTDGERPWPVDALRARPRLVRLANRVVGDSGEAADVVDEAIARLVSEPEPPECVAAWLARTVLRLAIDRRRFRERRLRASWVGDVDRLRSTPDDPAERAMATETSRALWSAIEALPPRQREVIVLREIDGASYADIGRVLDISEGATRAHAYAARESLRKSLAWMRPASTSGKEER